VVLVRTEISKEYIASVVRATRIGELGTTLAVTSSPIRVTLMMEAIRSSEMAVLTGATRCSISEDGILPSYLREYVKSYIALTGWAM
jgi:hypothetical protein